MYVAVKGGEKAIEQSYEALARVRRGDTAIPELTTAQIREQMPLAIAKVMGEGSLYDRDLAALAIKQAAGDLLEAVFLLRAYRTTLPRLIATVPVDTARMQIERRISATFKDVPGGQILGATYDYTQRLLDFSLAVERAAAEAAPDHLRGRYLGLFQLSWGIGGAITPVAFTWLLAHGATTVWWVLALIALVSAAYLQTLPRTLPAA